MLITGTGFGKAVLSSGNGRRHVLGHLQPAPTAGGERRCRQTGREHDHGCVAALDVFADVAQRLEAVVAAS